MVPYHTKTVGNEQGPEFVIRIQPLNLGEFLQSKGLKHILEKTELRAEYILQPHGCQSNRTYDIRHVNDGAEKLFPLIPLVRITANKRDRDITIRPPISQIRNRL